MQLQDKTMLRQCAYRKTNEVRTTAGYVSMNKVGHSINVNLHSLLSGKVLITVAYPELVSGRGFQKSQI